MASIFDRVIPARIGVESEKWDRLGGRFGPEIVPLSMADMEFESPPAIISALEEVAHSGLWGYTGWGDRYYEAIHSWMSQRHGWNIQRDWIVRTNGVIQGIGAAIRSFTAPGDGVVIQPPVYPLFARSVHYNGRTLVESPLRLLRGRYEMDYADLEEKLSRPTTTAMILCSPHNPVGRVWSKDELRRLGDLCLQHGVLVISDEIHCDLVQPDYPHTVFAKLGQEYAHNCVVGTSCSKTFSLAGLCCANMLVPDPAKKDALEFEVFRSGCHTHSTFGVRALEVGYEQCAPWLDELLIYLKGNHQFLVDCMAQHFPQVWISPLEGTYLAWLDFAPLGLSPKELQRFLEEDAHLFFAHGMDYGAASFERINLACSRAVLSSALDRLLAAAQKRGLA